MDHILSHCTFIMLIKTSILLMVYICTHMNINIYFYFTINVLFSMNHIYNCCPCVYIAQFRCTCTGMKKCAFFFKYRKLIKSFTFFFQPKIVFFSPLYLFFDINQNLLKRISIPTKCPKQFLF